MSPISHGGLITGQMESQRQLKRAAWEACGVSIFAMLAVGSAVLSSGEKLDVRAVLGLLPAALLLVAIAAIVFRSRVRSSQAAQAIANQQQRFERVIQGTGVGIWEADFVSGQIRVNETWSAMLGLTLPSSGTLALGEWQALVHPDDKAQLNAAVQTSRSVVDHVFIVDYRLRHAEGRWVWVVARGLVIERDAMGKPLLMEGTHSDITKRKEAETALTDSEGKFRSLFERSPMGICLTDFRSRRFLQANETLLAFSGYSREQFLQLSFEELVLPPAADALVAHVAQPESGFRHKGGSVCPVLISGIHMTDSRGRDVVWTFVQDISQRKAFESELAAAARRDRLTGLANRTAFMERLQTAVARVRNGQQSNFAVFFLDFDRFKVVNDAMGHQAGDELLVMIAERLRKVMRASDNNAEGDLANLIARFGGDEFLVLLNDLERADDAPRVAERILSSLLPTYSIRGRDVHSSASVGIVTSERCSDDAETVIRNADLAMYEAKRAGRSCCVVFNDDMHVRLSRSLLIETNLRHALGTPQITLAYQPIVELTTGKHTSVEALIRWNHPTLGPIAPAEFIPVAEESGLIAAMGEWVMREACAAMSRWRRTNPAEAPHVISVNVSRAELNQGQLLLQNVRAALAAADLPAECLLLEITESEVMRDSVASKALMHSLHEIGVRLAMDDFGTGTSSLGCLRDYPFDVIKIDRSFVNDLATGPDTLAVIHATITVIENLGKTSVAEGVETAEQLAILQSLGCHYAQGYYLGRPVPESQVLALPRNGEQARMRQRA
jgi:diguanylate cyclase (GGDEF)-like protein/PAS domain S-box-containing protein